MHLASVVSFFLAMGLVAVVETLVAFRAARRRGRLAGNLGLTLVTLLLTVALGGVMASRASPEAPSLVAVALYVVLFDFVTYLAHRLMHAVPLLWRFHRVHHADPHVDVTTSLRQHPLETSVRFVFLLVPVLLLEVPLQAFVLYRLVSALHALFEHANVRLWRPLDRVLSVLVATPGMHKVHHSRDARDTDSNYGNIFSVFDRLLGTFTSPARAEHVEYGLAGYDALEQQRFLSLLQMPFHEPQRCEAPDP